MTASSNLPTARIPTGWILLGISAGLISLSALVRHQEYALSMGQLQLLLGLSAVTSLLTVLLALALRPAASPLGWLAGGALASAVTSVASLLVASGQLQSIAANGSHLAWLWWIERTLMAVALFQFARCATAPQRTPPRLLPWLLAAVTGAALVLTLGHHASPYVDIPLAQPLELVPGLLYCLALLVLLSTGGGPSGFLFTLLIALLIQAWLHLALAPFSRDVLDGFSRDSLFLRLLAQGVLFLALCQWLADHLRKALPTVTVTPPAPEPDFPMPPPMPEESHNNVSRKVLLSLMEDFHRAREQEADAKQFAESIVDNLPVMVFVKDAKELRFQRINRAGEELLGVAAAQMLGKSDFDFFPREQAEFFIRTDQNVLKGNGVVDVAEEPIETARGTRWLHTRKIPVKNPRGIPQYLLGIAEDITERRRFIQQLEETSRYKSRFLANMSHELRTPMNSIIGFTEKVLQHAGPTLHERHRDALDTALRNAHHLLGLINDVLDLSKIEAGKMEIETETFDLRLTLELLRAEYTQMAEAKGLQFILQLPPEPLLLTTDRRKLVQVCHNLTSNAIKYTEHGSVNINVKKEQHPELGTAICLSVVDTGIGIRPEDQQKLFTEFSRASEARQKNIQGTGLGLLISAQLMALLGGRIQVRSVHGQGSTFTVWLPLQKT